MTTRSTVSRLALGAALAVGASSLASAQDSGPLIDALVRKGILTDQEGEELRADLVRDFATTSPGKIDLGTTVTRLRIAGDARVRYQYDNEQANGSANNQDRSRYRYRFRLGFTANLGAKWSTGVRFESNNSATSTNNDFGSGTDNFSKSTDGVNLGQVFLQFNDIGFLGSDGVDVRVGKFAHKFFNPGVNGFWIDSDINFEGLAEEIVYENVLGSTDLALRAGQFILNSNSSAGSKANTPSLLFIAQAELSNVSPASGAGWRAAPTFVAFAAPSAHDADLLATGASGTATSITRGTTRNFVNDQSVYTDLATILVPVEYTFVLKNGKPLAFYGTYGLNFQGEDRSDRLYGTQNPASYDQMFNAGVRYGSNRLAGDYQFTAEYRYVETGAYTSILLDSDFNGGRLGGAGPIVSASYNFTDAVSATITYFNSFNIDPNQPGVNPSANANNGLGFGKAQVLQIDLSARF